MATTMEERTAPALEDVASVGSRVSWGAIAAGAVLALALQFLFTLLGSAVGLSISNRMEPSTVQTAAVAWAVFSLCLSLFAGGCVVSHLTVGENKMEAMLYGIIMWGLLLALVLGLGAVGVTAGFSSLAGMANMAHSASTQDWEASARRAGVPANQIDEWRTKLVQQAQAPSSDDPNAETRPAATNEETRRAATRLTWYVFIGTWLSMMAAAAGALVGAGPTFRLVQVRAL